MSLAQKRAIVWCLTSEIDAFNNELVRRAGARRDYYGQPAHDVVVEHLRLLESARKEIEAIRAS